MRGERGSERTATVVATVAAAIMIAVQIASKATRDGLFLSRYPASDLPKAVVAAAIVALIAVAAVTRALERHGPARVVPLMFGGGGLLFLMEWRLADPFPGVVAWMLFLHVAAFGSVAISGFWSVVNERFDPHAAKRRVARIGAGASLGGVVGGIVAERVGALGSLRSMLLLLALSSLVAAVAVARVGAGPRSSSSGTGGMGPGLKILVQNRYLRQMAVLVALTGAAGAMFDYALKAQVSTVYDGGEKLMRFFALYYTGVAVATFMVQAVFARRALARLGLAGTVAVLPLAAAVLGALGVLVTRLWSVVLVRAAEAVLSSSLYRSAYELLYTPVPAERKRRTKAIIDVAVSRFGDVIGSGLVLGALWLASGMGTRLVLAIAVLGALSALWLARRLHQGYVGELAESLRSGALKLEDADVMDATTRQTLSEVTLALDRERLLAEIRALRVRQGEAAGGDIEGAADGARAEKASARIEALASRDPEVVRAALREPLDGVWAGYVIPLLGRKDVRAEALDALRAAAPRCGGQIADALLDRRQPQTVRRWAARALAACPSRRAVSGLVEGLGDPDFEVRYQCGRALAHLVHEERVPFLETQAAYEAVMEELGAEGRAARSRRILEDDDEGRAPWLGHVVRARLDRSLEHVFTLLSLFLDREPLALSLRALESGDRMLQGTALEYIENVVPEPICRRLWPFLGLARSAPRQWRPREAVADELLRSMDSLRIDRSLLRERGGKTE